jgi:hypothetical protein
MTGRKLTAGELDAITHIEKRGNLSKADSKKLRDAVAYRRFKSKKWPRPAIGLVYGLAIEFWPELEQDPEVGRRAERIIGPITLPITIAVPPPFPEDPDELKRAHIDMYWRLQEAEKELKALKEKEAETNRKKGRRGKW